MDQPTVSKTVTIVNPQGLHARPADLFVKLANRFSAAIRVRKDNESVDGKSILSILTLGAEQGTQLEILATGDDAPAAVAALTELVEQGFVRDAGWNDPSWNETSDSSTPSPQ
jgi:phosphotransferase system HPr (HPr) family protein